MKLVLSSCDFRNKTSRQVIFDNLPRPIAQCRLLFVPNEKSTSDKVKGGKYHDRMAEFGFTPALVRVLDYTDPVACLDLDIDVLYISGGNTFLTLDRLRRCGFDRELIRYIRAGVTYIGGSAGAHMVCTDLTHVALYDPPPAGMTDLCGLGLTDVTLLCHYTPARQVHLEALRAQNKRVIPLTNSDSCVIQ